MKSKAERAPSGFQPVTLTITLETPEEFQALLDVSGANLTVAAAVRQKHTSDYSTYGLKYSSASDNEMQAVLSDIYYALEGFK